MSIDSLLSVHRSTGNQAAVANTYKPSLANPFRFYLEYPPESASFSFPVWSRSSLPLPFMSVEMLWSILISGDKEGSVALADLWWEKLHHTDHLQSQRKDWALVRSREDQNQKCFPFFFLSWWNYLSLGRTIGSLYRCLSRPYWCCSLASNSMRVHQSIVW